MTMILDSFFLALLAVLTQLCHISAAHVVPLEAIRAAEDNRTERRISPDLFNSLGELARIVDISYCIGTTGVQKPFQCLSHCRELKGFELITTWHTGPLLVDSCGYIALSHPPSPKRIIVAFRGTYSLANAIIDLSAYPQEYVPYPAGNDTDSDDNDKQPKCSNCSVHAGFMSAWRNTRSTILETISSARDQYPDYRLELVGHSLGGAVAALAGTEMRILGWDPVVTTFGEPRVGNKAFVEYLDTIFHLDVDDMHAWTFRRVTHVNDLVPLFPLTEWGYEMHAGEIYISRVDLPFSVEDVVYCQGGRDKECISGGEGEAEAETTAPLLLRPPHEINSVGDSSGQQVLSGSSWSSSSSQEMDALNPELQTTPRLPLHLVPPRFRLWELFYSHRDYFLRLGLCVPGGDPSGKW
ncbi:Alpha/Beta hydrolase protein [Aspergillus cavernicola]|uniref:feruloyl esterase n=1 Tax=Aspergillus cavernicola TaxID=176166 RepID=A0ABR4ILT0_9EURO